MVKHDCRLGPADGVVAFARFAPPGGQASVAFGRRIRTAPLSSRLEDSA